MIRIYLLIGFIITVMVACIGSQNDMTCKDFQITGRDVHNAIKRDFRKSYHYFKNASDTCYFKAYIKHNIDTSELLPFFVFKNCLIFNDEFTVFPFSYAVLRKRETEEFYFYGHYDVYRMIEAPRELHGGVIRFENPALVELLNHFVTEEMESRKQFLEIFLMNIYVVNSDKSLYHKTAIFRQVYNYEKFVSLFRTVENANDFDEMFLQRDFENLIVLNNDFFGGLVFRFNNKGPLAIEEFILPAKNMMRFAYTDNATLELNDCSW